MSTRLMPMERRSPKRRIGTVLSRFKKRSLGTVTSQRRIKISFRWNCTYCMLLRAYKLRCAIKLYQLPYKPSRNKRSSPYSVTDDKITAADWDVVKQYIRLLQPYVASTKQLQGNAEDEGLEGTHGSLWEVFMYFQVLGTVLDKAVAEQVAEDDSHIKVAIMYGKGELDEYRDILMSETPYYYAAVVLHPFKKLA